MRDIYGPVAEAEAFRAPFARHLAELRRDGTAAVLARYLGG
jgi:hypothetical protein